MDLQLLEVFCRVYKARSFSRAARELGLTQPTVSAHIKALEEDLGTQVFNRLGREIEPTQAGRLVYEQARSLLTLKRDLTSTIAQFLNRIEGELVVGASTVPGEYLLPGLLAGFHAAHPAVRARLRISDTAATIDHVRQGEIQFGMVGGVTADADLVFEPFARDSLVLAVPARSPWADRGEISIRQLQELPLLLREPGSGTRKVLEEALARRKVAASSLQIVAELGSTSAIKEGIKQGHGASFVSALAIVTERAAGLLRVVRVRAFGPLQRTYYTVLDRRRVLSPVYRSFKDYLAARSH